MMRGACGASVVVVLGLLLQIVPAQDAKYSIKTAATPPPKELAASIKKLLPAQSVQLLDPAGKTVCEVWFRQEVPADATPEQIKNGLTYREIKQSEVLGAIKFEQEWRDYRKQKVKAGLYTLRLGYQPMDGDHTGSSEFQEFLVVVDAAKDTKPELMEVKELAEVGARSIGTGHPGVFMLVPLAKVGAAPVLTAMPKNHWVVKTKADVVVGGKKTGTNLGIGLTLVGTVD